MTTHFLAGDFGAESGRLMLGALEHDRLTLTEVHRFPNPPLKANGALHWDIARLFAELRAGLRKAADSARPIASLSCDAWGVDYLLFDERGALLAPTFHYRDPRSACGVRAVQARIDWPAIFAETGIQFMAINTLYQLAAESPDRLRAARVMLGVADGFHFLLTGAAKAEQSFASTTQLYNPRTHAWSRRLIDAVGLPTRIFPELVPSGTRLGPLRPELAAETGLAGLEVIATCSHDTGAAVAAVPATGGRWAYLSSGTWSLMGVERAAPILTDACREMNFTNEIGFGGSVRLLKNIVGLWIVQECRRAWAEAGQPFDYETLTERAAAAAPFGSLIDPTDPRFLEPGDMPAKIAAFCRATNQPAPADAGATIRCVLESLALLYARTLRQLERLTGEAIEQLHIVGGGSRNALLNQFTANALELPVLAGPVEATAAGNVLLQAITLGHLPSLAAARAVVRDSFTLTPFAPRDAEAWQAAARRFDSLALPIGK